jgi:hypothetical protein
MRLSGQKEENEQAAFRQIDRPSFGSTGRFGEFFLPQKFVDSPGLPAQWTLAILLRKAALFLVGEALGKRSGGFRLKFFWWRT